MKDEALKLALEALDIVKIHFTQNRHVNEAITAIKQALAAPVQEPVAWRYDLKHAGSFAGVSREYSPIKLSIGENWTPLYTTPPAAQRLWVGLRDDEIFSVLDKLQAIYNGPPTGDSRVIFAQAIEAKLKEKNTWVGLTRWEIDAKLKEKNT